MFFCCQQWSLLRIYNWWIHEWSSRSNFFIFMQFSVEILPPQTQWSPVCWPHSVGDEHLSSIILTALFTNSAIHKAAGSSVTVCSQNAAGRNAPRDCSCCWLSFTAYGSFFSGTVERWNSTSQIMERPGTARLTALWIVLQAARSSIAGRNGVQRPFSHSRLKGLYLAKPGTVLPAAWRKVLLQTKEQSYSQVHAERKKCPLVVNGKTAVGGTQSGSLVNSAVSLLWGNCCCRLVGSGGEAVWSWSPPRLMDG